jgi:hypothetical protein
MSLTCTFAVPVEPIFAGLFRRSCRCSLGGAAVCCSVTAVRAAELQATRWRCRGPADRSVNRDVAHVACCATAARMDCMLQGPGAGTLLLLRPKLAGLLREQGSATVGIRSLYALRSKAKKAVWQMHGWWSGSSQCQHFNISQIFTLDFAIAELLDEQKLRSPCGNDRTAMRVCSNDSHHNPATRPSDYCIDMAFQRSKTRTNTLVR